MTKGIAIQTILMLLVGILVVGIIVYMVYRYFVQSPLSEQECRSRAIVWCTGCKNTNAHIVPPAGWDTAGSSPNDELVACAGNYFPGLLSTSTCTGFDDWCAAFIPL